MCSLLKMSRNASHTLFLLRDLFKSVVYKIWKPSTFLMRILKKLPYVFQARAQLVLKIADKSPFPLKGLFTNFTQQFRSSHFSVDNTAFAVLNKFTSLLKSTSHTMLTSANYDAATRRTINTDNKTECLPLCDGGGREAGRCSVLRVTPTKERCQPHLIKLSPNRTPYGKGVMILWLSTMVTFDPR